MTDKTATGDATSPEPDATSGATPGGGNTPDGAKPTGDKQEAQGAPDTPLGDGGTSALEKERDARRDAERRVAQLRDKVTELEDAGKSELDRAVSQLKRAGDDLAKANERIAVLEGELTKRDLDALKLKIA